MQTIWTTLGGEGGALLRAKELLSIFLPTFGRLLLILVLAKFSMTFGISLVSRLFAPERRRRSLDPKKAKTMEALLKSMLRYLVYFIAAISMLSELGIRTDSLLASAGIVGLAVGFGAQSLVRDVLTGFFIIFEDQFVVGDYVETAGLSGYVEEMGLRVTKLRDFSGVIHILPNGEIGKVTNHSRGNRAALVDVAVAYDEDVDRVQTVLDQAMQETARQQSDIVEGPKVMGITELGPSGMVWRVWAKTLPMQQWSVERELRRAISIAFQQAGILIYYPHVVTVPYAPEKE